MHQQYAKAGVVFVSLSLDDAEQKESVLKFLKSQKATFANYLLAEETEFWQNALKINGPPAVLVYDRQGKLSKQFDTSDPDKPFDHTDVEKLVKHLLEKK